MHQADRVTERQNDSMTVWQNSRAAKEPALVLLRGPATLHTHAIHASPTSFNNAIHAKDTSHATLVNHIMLYMLVTCYSCYLCYSAYSWYSC